MTQNLSGNQSRSTLKNYFFIKSIILFLVSCEPEADIPCDQKCGQPCPPDPEDSNDVTSDDPQPENTDFSGPIECRPGTVDPINCFKFRLCMHGRMVTVHCNEGLVHSGYKKECQGISVNL